MRGVWEEWLGICLSLRLTIGSSPFCRAFWRRRAALCCADWAIHTVQAQQKSVAPTAEDAAQQEVCYRVGTSSTIAKSASSRMGHD